MNMQERIEQTPDFVRSGKQILDVGNKTVTTFVSINAAKRKSRELQSQGHSLRVLNINAVLHALGIEPNQVTQRNQ